MGNFQRDSALPCRHTLYKSEKPNLAVQPVNFTELSTLITETVSSVTTLLFNAECDVVCVRGHSSEVVKLDRKHEKQNFQSKKKTKHPTQTTTGCLSRACLQ